MKNYTKIQLITVVLWVFYGLYELSVAKWADSQVGAIFRFDLIYIYPPLVSMTVISVVQYFNNRK